MFGINRERRRARGADRALMPLLFAAALLGVFAYIRAGDNAASAAAANREMYPDCCSLSYEEKIRFIENSGIYPESLVDFARSYREAADFVYSYPELRDKHPEIDLSREAESGDVPCFLQWDPRWGYETYGDGFIGNSGCGPVCLSMAAVYLTGDAGLSPPVIAGTAETNGYYSPGNGTKWSLMTEGTALFGLKGTQLPLDEECIKDALDSGSSVILSVGPGDFTKEGHFILLAGYTDEGFSVHDPNSALNSAECWSFEKLRPQVMNLWAIGLRD